MAILVLSFPSVLPCLPQDNNNKRQANKMPFQIKVATGFFIRCFWQFAASIRRKLLLADKILERRLSYGLERN
jgi:hypothetical protein